jgi:putative ABC transport system permease protein
MISGHSEEREFHRYMTLQDTRYALRSMRRSPGFTFTAVLVLALGIGATSTIFSIVDTVLVKPLPYLQGDRIVSIGLTGFGQWSALAFAPDYLDWRARNHVFEEMAAYEGTNPALTEAGEPTVLHCERVTQSFFRTLRVQPILGRAFTPAEDRPGAGKVILITYGLWQRRFGGTRNILGKSLTLDGEPHTVVGVLGPGFRFPGSRVEAMLPLGLNEAEQAKRDAILIFSVVARLKNGAAIAQARAEIEHLLDQSKSQYARFYLPEMKISMVPLQERQVANMRLALLALFGAVGCVLLIACANVANLLLSRAAARQREMAVRAALGAGRKRLVRQLLTESALLGLAGGAAGLLLVTLTLKSILHFAPSIPRIDDVTVGLRVLGFTILTSLLAGLAFGWLPAIGATVSISAML